MVSCSIAFRRSASISVCSPASVAHQNLVYSLEPQARVALNALLFTGVFIGMALGSVLGSRLYVVAGWNGVVVLVVVTGAIALAIRLQESARLASIARAAIKKPAPHAERVSFNPAYGVRPYVGQTL